MNHQDLGVDISSNLNGTIILTTLPKRPSKFSVFYKEIYTSVQPGTKKITYLGLVRPLLEYASAVIDPYTVNKQGIQRKAACFITKNYNW